MATAGDAEPRETHGQTTPETGGSQEERTKRTRGKEIEHEIKKLRDTYGRKQGRAAKPVLFNKVNVVFQKMSEVTCLLYINNTYEYMEEIVKGIKKVTGKMDNR